MYRMIKAADEEYIGYIAPRGPKTESELNWVAEVIARKLKMRHLEPTRENIIDCFRDMCEDYDDWWARGLRDRAQEDRFINDIVARLADFGIDALI